MRIFFRNLKILFLFLIFSAIFCAFFAAFLFLQKNAELPPLFQVQNFEFILQNPVFSEILLFLRKFWFFIPPRFRLFIMFLEKNMPVTLVLN